MLNKILFGMAEFDALSLMVMKPYLIYFWPYFDFFLRQEISPYIEESLLNLFR